MAAPRHAAHAADDDHHQRGQEIAHVLARRDGQRRAADDAGEARQPGAEREGDGEDALHIDAGGRQHGRGRRPRRGSSCPTRVRLRNSQSADADHDRRRPAPPGDRSDTRRTQRQRGGAVEPVRRLELIGLAAPDRQHQIGEHDGDADGDQGLAQFLRPPCAGRSRSAAAAPASRHGEESGGHAENQEPVASAAS